MVDRGMENRGRMLQLFKSHGVIVRFIGVQAPHQLGRGERQGSILKEIAKHLIASRQIDNWDDMALVITEAVTVKNNRVHHASFTPSQWVLGKMPAEVDVLMSGGDPADHLAQHQEIQDAETSFSRQVVIRGAAREAFASVDSSQRIRAAMLRKSTPIRGPFASGDLICFQRRPGRGKQMKWFGPARVVGQEGRSTLWVIHAGVPITVSVESCRYATGAEAIAKRQLELRPSRKRRKQDEAPPGIDSDPFEYSFGDDLSGMSNQPDHRVYFDPSHNDESGGSYDQNVDEPAQVPDVGSSTTTALPPGLPPPAHEPGPEEHALPDDASEGIATSLEEEPEQENIPDSRRDSTAGTTSTEVGLNQLQTAMRRSPAALDGHISQLQSALRRSPTSLDGHPIRQRSRFPPPTTSATSRTAETHDTPQRRALAAFLGRRVNKKTAAARAKELNYERSEGDERSGIEKARSSEWGNWRSFEAVDVLGPKEAQAYLDSNPHVKPTLMRWVDINKAHPWEEPKHKSRIVVRGDLEKGAEDAGTDSPTCSATMLSVLLSMAARKDWRIRGGDITASFLQHKLMTRTLVLTPPKGGLPDVESGSILIARKPVYGPRTLREGSGEGCTRQSFKRVYVPYHMSKPPMSSTTTRATSLGS